MNKTLAAHYYKLSADQGDAIAQHNYGRCLDKGEGVEMNKSLAAHYYKLSADQGNSHAQSDYDRCLAQDEGPSVLSVFAGGFVRAVSNYITVRMLGLFLT
jgi:TPR repeat protein